MSRKFERVELNQTITVTDAITNQRFGELVNLSAEGLMIITDQQLDTHSIFQLCLQLPVAIAGHTTIELGADCLWCREAENFNRYWSGFQIIDASDLAVQQLTELTNHYQK